MISRDLDGFARAVCGALQASRGGVTRKVDYYDKLEVEENFPIGIQNYEFLVLAVCWLSLLKRFIAERRRFWVTWLSA